VAHADTIFTLTEDSCSGGCGISPFGTVTLHQTDSDTVGITVDLFNGNQFVTNGNHEAFSFNVSGAAVTISGLSSSFSIDAGTVDNAGFGSFGYGLVTGGTIPPPLTFVVSRASGLLISDFVGNADSIAFAADILSGLNGNTGAVGAFAAVPEPATFGLIGLGLIAGAILRRPRKPASF